MRRSPGSKHGAEKGELTYMIGGDRETFDRAMPILKQLGKKHIYCGLHGLGPLRQARAKYHSGNHGGGFLRGLRAGR